MDLSTIELDREAAAERFAAYERAAKARHNDEDEAIAAGYKALSEGKRLISLRETVKAGGVDELARPRLAVAASTAQWVWLSVGTRMSWVQAENKYRSFANGTVRYSVIPNPRLSRGRVGLRRRIELSDVIPKSARVTDDRVASWRYRAMVPIVPPDLRPTRALTTYHTLFEAEWGLDPSPPVDPALIQHLFGDLWVVVAEWDLTPLERAVLADRIYTN